MEYDFEPFHRHCKISLNQPAPTPDDELARLRAEVMRLREQLATTERIYAHFVPQQLLQFLAIRNIRDIRLGL